MMDTIPKLLFDYCTKHAETEAVLSKDSNNNFQPISHREFYNIIKDFGCGLIDSGIKRENHIGVISDNRKEWLWADFAILSIGAVDVPRGSDSTAEEIRYILFHGDCVATLVEDNTQLEKILSIANKLRLLKMIIVMDNSSTVKKKGKISIYNFSDILERGKKYLEKNPGAFEEEIGKSKPEDLATIIYTSGTTGEPKGVMLSHSNFMHQVISPHQYLYLDEKDVYFAVLPVWHAYERSCEYYAFFHGVIIAYSRLVAKIMIEDMGKVRPNVFVSVPRIWVSLKSAINRKIREEGGIRLALFNFFIAVGTIHSKLLTMFRGLLPRFKKRVHLIDVLISFIPLILLTPLALLGNLLVFSKIKARLGGRFYLGVSGAGALPPHVDDFFAGAGLLILEGYGLTEAAPIVSVRKRNAPVPGTIGPPLPEVEAKVLDEEGNELPPGKKGILFIRGPNVMIGYYKKPEETKKVITEDGWLNTGDLAMMTYRGEIKIMGRVKETIVLLGGENVEPGPIEDVICQSEYIDQAFVAGQDKTYLGALVVPNKELVEKFAGENGIHKESFASLEDFYNCPQIYRLLIDEINSNVNFKKGFKLFERINKIRILTGEFETGVEMTHTLKLKRNVIQEKFKKEIESLYK